MLTQFLTVPRQVLRASVALCLGAVFCTPFQANAQGDAPELVATAEYKFLLEGMEAPALFDLAAVASQIAASRYDYSDALNLSLAPDEDPSILREDPFVQSLLEDPTQPSSVALGEGLVAGGISTAAAMVILNIPAKCKTLNVDQNDNYVPFKSVILGRSSMRAVQYSFDVDADEGLGRGQFDIQTTKFALCRNTKNNDVSGIPINVRWVFNVNGDSLNMTSGQLTGPKGKAYEQNFRADGIGIEVVLIEIDGDPLLVGHPVYKVVENACIDIWLPKKIDGFDIWVPTSIPGSGVFCAGGFCKKDPPWLEATQ